MVPTITGSHPNSDPISRFQTTRIKLPFVGTRFQSVGTWCNCSFKIAAVAVCTTRDVIDSHLGECCSTGTSSASQFHWDAYLVISLSECSRYYRVWTYTHLHLSLGTLSPVYRLYMFEGIATHKQILRSGIRLTLEHSSFILPLFLSSPLLFCLVGVLITTTTGA